MFYEKRFHNLEAAIEGVHAHFKQRIEAPGVNGSADALYRLKLAVHEWIANLVRHAHFEGRTPEVHVRIWKKEEKVHCAIEDNSNGFDLQSQIIVQQHISDTAQTLPEGGMGLLLLKASTEYAEYIPVNGHANRLRLCVTLDGPPKDAGGDVSEEEPVLSSKPSA